MHLKLLVYLLHKKEHNSLYNTETIKQVYRAFGQYKKTIVLSSRLSIITRKYASKFLTHLSTQMHFVLL